MKKPLLLNIALDSIDIGKRLRPADGETVAALCVDMADRGLRSPIELVRCSEDSARYLLVSGLHRLTAAQELGWESIPAFIREDASEAEIRLDEIMENIARRDLSPLDRAVFANALRQVYQEAHPESRHGGVRSGDDFQVGNIPTWFIAAAERTGWGAETLRKSARIGEHLTDESIVALRSTPLADNQKELMALSKYGPAIQAQLVWQITKPDSPARSVNAALRAVANQPEDSEDRSDKDLKSLTAIWARASAQARRAFLSDHADEISSLWQREAD